MFALLIAAVLGAGGPASDELMNRLLSDESLPYELNEEAEPALTCFGKGVQAAESQADPKTIESIRTSCGIDRATAAAAAKIKLKFKDLSAEDAQALADQFITQMAFWATLTRFPTEPAVEKE